MTVDGYLELIETHDKIMQTRYMVDLLTKGVQVTPVTKGVLGNYKCKQDIIERDKNLLEHLEIIQKYLHEVCDEMSEIYKNIEREIQ